MDKLLYIDCVWESAWPSISFTCTRLCWAA